MTERAPPSVVVPPELDYLPGLFLPDLVAARLRTQVARWARRSGAQACFDPEGATARALAHRLAASGARAIAICHANDPGPAALLERALRAAGLMVAGCYRGDRLPLALEALTRSGPAMPATAIGTSLFVTEPGDSLPLPGVVFARQRADRWTRVSAGAWQAIPADVRTIEIVHRDRAIVAFPTTLFAIPMRASAAADWPELVARVCDAVGPDSVRFVLPSIAAPAQGAALWAHRYGLHDAVARERLHAAVSRHLPLQLDWLETVLGFFQLGVSPLEEMFAGNSLVDRHQELMQNLSS
ncbi:MAG: hypothetical protein U1E76_13095 [Planctomycetota bacterium]